MCLLVHARVAGAGFPGSVSGTCSTRACFPRPLAFAPSTPHSSRACSPTSSLLRKGLTSPARASSAWAQRLPDADPTPTTRVAKLETSRFPRGVCIDMPGSVTTPGCSGTRDSAPMHVAFRRIRMRRHPRAGFFRGSMAGLSTPLSTLHVTPRDAPRMTRGQRGSLLLGWRGLSPLTLRRFRRRNRGRNAHCCAPPAQIPASAIHAPGSHLGQMTSRRTIFGVLARTRTCCWSMLSRLCVRHLFNAYMFPSAPAVQGCTSVAEGRMPRGDPPSLHRLRTRPELVRRLHRYYAKV